MIGCKGTIPCGGTIGHEGTIGREGTIRYEGMIRVKGTILWKSSCAKHSLGSRARQRPEFLVIVIFHTMDCSY